MRMARCLGGPLDGKVKPAQGRRLVTLMPSQPELLADWSESPPEYRPPHVVYYDLARSLAGEFLWLCDES